VDDFALVDEEGNEISYRVLSSQPTRYQILSPINLPGDLRLKRYDIEWQPKVPALGYATYRIRPFVISRKAIENISDVNRPLLENEQIKVEVQQDGSFHILDKVSGKQYLNQGRFQDAGDRGDLYVFLKTDGKRQSEIWNGIVEMEAIIR